MYEKTKNMLDNNVIDEYKKRSLELSRKYMLDNILRDFRKMVVE